MADQLLTDLASLHISRDDGGDGGPRHRGSLGYFVLGAALLGAALLGYLVVYPAVQARLFKTPVALTEIALVSPAQAQAQVELTATGYVVPQTLSKVGAKVTGRVAQVLVRQGQRVRSGEILLKLDEIAERSAIAAARARVLTAEARVQTARANVAETIEQARRARGLFQRDVGPLASAVDLEARAEALSAAVNAAAAEVRAAQAEVVTQKTALDQLTVVAPIDGTVLTKPPELGEVVGPQQSLLELADLSQESLVIEADVPEARLARVRIGGPCEIVLDAYPSQRRRGKTLEILPRVSRAKATVAVKVQFADDVAGVLPDMAARVNFLSKELTRETLQQAPKVLLPAAALAERGGAKVVFVFNKDTERVQRTPVVLGAALGGGFELASGPPPGTRLVRDPAPTLNDGQRVQERESNER